MTCISFAMAWPCLDAKQRLADEKAPNERRLAMKLDLGPAEFAELIRQCNLSFAETARFCGVDPSTARRWTKSTKPPRYAVAMIKLEAAGKLDVLMYRALKGAYNDPSRVDQLLSLVKSVEP